MADALTSGSANLEAMDAAPAYQAAMTRLLVSKLGLKQGRVLDFGAGSGTYTRAAAAASSWKMAAMEPYEALHPRIGAGIEVHASLDAIAPHSLDGAFSLNVLEHIADDVGALAALAARCKPGSPVFILVPAHMSLWTPMDDLVGHVRRYSLEGLEQLSRRAGLTVCDKGWFDATGYFATAVYRAAVRAGALKRATGAVSKSQVGAFDRAFSLAEPVFRCIGTPFGKNCWVRLATNG